MTRTPLLLVHGYLATAWTWERYVEFFTLLGYSCTAMNLRGRSGGEPVVDIGRVTMDEYYADAQAAAQELGRPVVFGHSMGGLLALKLAEADLVRAAVLISPAPPRGIPLISLGLVRHMAAYLPAILRSRAVRARFTDFRSLVLNRIPAQEQRELFARFVPDSGRAARDMMLGSMRVDPDRVHAPMLVVGGDDDHFVPWRVDARVADRYGTARLLTHDHGHMLVREPGWEIVAAQIASWLEANHAGPASNDAGEIA
jgi:pimeloyl-ACP methyl ester carboxylesterase